VFFLFFIVLDVFVAFGCVCCGGGGGCLWFVAAGVCHQVRKCGRRVVVRCVVDTISWFGPSVLVWCCGFWGCCLGLLWWWGSRCCVCFCFADHLWACVLFERGRDSFCVLGVSVFWQYLSRVLVLVAGYRCPSSGFGRGSWLDVEFEVLYGILLF